MKLLKIRNCLTIAVVAMASLLCSDTNAQQAWTPDYSPSCSEGGGCRHADDSLELIPYGQNYGYENEIGSARIPYRDSMRTPYQYRGGNLDSGYGSCGHGGSCSRSQANQRNDRSPYSESSVRCPYEQRQLEQANYDQRFMYDDRESYRDGNAGGSNYERGSSSWGSNSDPNYTISDRRNFDDYSQAPADRRPELLNIPSVELDRRFGKNERNQQVNPLAVPPTSTRIIPPPELPPQPLASNSRSPRQQLLPPTNFPSSRNSGQSHAGHDHSGHDHSGHNH